MRAELLKKRNELKVEIDRISKAEEKCDKEKNFKLNKEKNEKKQKYQFINNLLKVIK